MWSWYEASGPSLDLRVSSSSIVTNCFLKASITSAVKQASLCHTWFLRHTGMLVR